MAWAVRTQMQGLMDPPLLLLPCLVSAVRTWQAVALQSKHSAMVGYRMAAEMTEGHKRCMDGRGMHVPKHQPSSRSDGILTYESTI